MGVTDFSQSQGRARELLLLVSSPLFWTIIPFSLKKSIWDYQSEEGRERGKVKKMKGKLGNLFVMSLVRGWSHKLRWSCFSKVTAMPESSLLPIILFMQRVFKQEGQNVARYSLPFSFHCGNVISERVEGKRIRKWRKGAGISFCSLKNPIKKLGCDALKSIIYPLRVSFSSKQKNW